MSDQLTLEIVTPERLVFSERVDEVVLPGVEGYLGVLSGHAPLLTRLGAGELSYRRGNEQHYFAVSGGFAEVLREGVEVLARTAEPADQIDAERARRAKERAEARLKSGECELERAEAQLKRAIARLQVSGRSRS